MNLSVVTLSELFGGGAAVAAGGGTAFYAVRWVVEWMAGRQDKREARLDAGTDKLISGLERQLAAALTRLEAVEKGLAECQRKHAESDAEVLRLRAIIDGKGEINQRAQAIVAADRIEQRRAGE